jgi:hypothetical protein
MIIGRPELAPFPIGGEKRELAIHTAQLRMKEFKNIISGYSSRGMETRREGCQPYAPAALHHQGYFWYSFLLEAESNLRP